MYSLALLATAAVASARVFDQLPTVPQGWKKTAPALAADKLSLKIGLKQQHAEALEQTVLAISSPGHPDYGKHLSREELRRFVAPSTQATDEVTSWLAGYGITPAVDNDWITISTDVATADALLDADFSWYEDAQGGDRKLRTLSYSVPDSVAHHVDLVQPTTRFGRPGAKRSTIFDVTMIDELEENDALKVEVLSAADADAATAAAAAGACNTTVTPACLKAQYNIGYTPSAANESLVAFASYLEQSARLSDLAAFQTAQLPQAVGQNFTVVTINDGVNDQTSSADASEPKMSMHAWV